jgi:hypothetical protein
LRKILTPQSKKDIEVCTSCSQLHNRILGHEESILKSLEIQEETEFAIKWNSSLAGDSDQLTPVLFHQPINSYTYINNSYAKLIYFR